MFDDFIESLKGSRKATVSSVRVAGTSSYYILYTYKFRDLGSVCVCVRERIVMHHKFIII